jgi:hypothetical protein
MQTQSGIFSSILIRKNDGFKHDLVIDQLHCLDACFNVFLIAKDGRIEINKYGSSLNKL